MVEGLKRERVKCCVVVCCVDMIFIRNNVQTAVRDVRGTGLLGGFLYVPGRRRREIESKFRGNDEKVKKKYVDYFVDHDPLASWRRVIVVLDTLKSYGGEPEKIRHLAEAVTGEGRKPETVLTVISSPD